MFIVYSENEFHFNVRYKVIIIITVCKILLVFEKANFINEDQSGYGIYLHQRQKEAKELKEN